MITVSAPGKVHLMGEHAVVYGRPAFLTAINRRLTVSVTSGKQTHDTYISHILSIVQQHFHLDTLEHITITIDSDIPVGYHLGSSAAVAAGVIGAVMYFVKKTWNPILINQLAYEAEKFAHGNPSGGDNTTVIMGGFVWYRKELDFLKSMWQLPLTLPQALNHFFLIDTGKPKESTKDMIEIVRKNTISEDVFQENEIQTKRVATAIKTADEAMLIDAIRKGERSLEQMGVVSKKAMNVIGNIEKIGGAAKILGGGGKTDGVGYVLCYAHNPPVEGMPIVLGEEGIRLEKKV